MDLNWDDLLGDFQGRSFSPRQNNSNNNNQGMNWLNSLFTGASGVLGNIIQGVFNTRQVEATNKANRELVDAQNAAAKEEAELAYHRSRPENQVANMMNAGMSRAGAINALNGGGSYQPAPVNTAQDQAPQIDTTSAINAIQSAAQLQEQKRQFNMQHAEQKRQFNLNHAETKRMNDDALLTSGKQRELLGVEIDGKTIENQLQGILRDIEQELYDDGTTINAERSKRIAEKSAAVLNSFRDERIMRVMEDMTDEELRKLFEIQGFMNTVTRITNYDAPRVINDVLKYGKKVISKFL